MSSQAYTPGLKRKAATLVRKTRRLPVQGEVLVKKGDAVNSDTIVARAFLSGDVEVVNVAGLLGIDPWETSRYLLKKEGDEVKEGEPIGMVKLFFGLFKTRAYAPVSGTIERISDVTGQVLIRESQVPLEVDAYIPGEVVETFPNEGVTIEIPAAFIQGIFGVGGERKGNLMMIAENPDEVLTPKQIGSKSKGRILVGGALVTNDALQKAIKTGVQGIVVGGIDDHDLTTFLGYKIGIAITGQEDIPLTLIVTEGFGEIAMSEKTFSLLEKFDDKPVSINGATQIRAGVMRPEIVIPRPELVKKKLADFRGKKDFLEQGLLPGTPVRIIRKPYFGALGVVSKLPVPLQTVETESDVRVLEAELANGKRVIVPRANVEIIEE